MPEERLTTRERAALLVLMAEARELTNAELRELAGFTLDGAHRRRLNDLGWSSAPGPAAPTCTTSPTKAPCGARRSCPPRGLPGRLRRWSLHVLLAGLRRHLRAPAVPRRLFTPTWAIGSRPPTARWLPLRRLGAAPRCASTLTTCRQTGSTGR
ncbi:hypothetical protein K7G98_23850 [Saccharothrix sp. MB29]|nr:hypothetical protein [Saccharothrix sp. MB29]